MRSAIATLTLLLHVVLVPTTVEAKKKGKAAKFAMHGDHTIDVKPFDDDPKEFNCRLHDSKHGKATKGNPQYCETAGGASIMVIESYDNDDEEEDEDDGYDATGRRTRMLKGGPRRPKKYATSIIDSESGNTYYIDQDGEVTQIHTSEFLPEMDAPEIPAAGDVKINQDVLAEMQANGGGDEGRKLRGHIASIRSSTGSLDNSPFLENFLPATAHKQNRRRLDDGRVIDIMVIWTPEAEAAQGGADKEVSIRNVINGAIEWTNLAYDNSGIDTMLRLVHAQRADGYAESSDYSQNLYNLSPWHSNFDGSLSWVEGVRNEYGADFVAMIVDGGSYCGVAWLGPSTSSVYSVTSWGCAGPNLSFAHEVGHNMGCNHDKGTTNSCSTSSSNYGYRDPDAQYRSVLAYSCTSGQCDNNAGGDCTRKAFFSRPDMLFEGKPMGSSGGDTGVTDNAKQINDNRVTMANYRQTVVVDCQTDSDCNDGNSCTINTCDVVCQTDMIPDCCGNDVCDAGENEVNCVEDCGCGNGACEAGEDTGNCPSDCPCIDNPEGWYDADGPNYNCAWYGSGSTYCSSYGDSYANFGTTANQACCACGGGSSTTGGPGPTPAPPTTSPTTPSPTESPSSSPTSAPTPPAPTKRPSSSPSQVPSSRPSASPTSAPSTPIPTKSPSASPSHSPSFRPSASPTPKPSSIPSSPPTDVNECLANNGECDLLTTCTNIPNGRICGDCPSGYSGSGETGCTDRDECSEGTDNCHANSSCGNTPGGYTCTCNAGYSGNGITCVDNDECLDGTNTCDSNASCQNTPGSFTCSCNVGFMGDGYSCTNINECSAGNNGGCDPLTSCVDTPGSYYCTPCPSGYTGTGEAGCVEIVFAFTDSSEGFMVTSRPSVDPDPVADSCWGYSAGDSDRCTRDIPLGATLHNYIWADWMVDPLDRDFRKAEYEIKINGERNKDVLVFVPDAVKGNSYQLHIPLDELNPVPEVGDTVTVKLKIELDSGAKLQTQNMPLNIVDVPLEPTSSPTKAPSPLPTTGAPTGSPTPSPTKAPSTSPTKAPSQAPTTGAPTKPPSDSPTAAPVVTPSPTKSPSQVPTTTAPTASCTLPTGPGAGEWLIITTDGCTDGKVFDVNEDITLIFYSDAIEHSSVDKIEVEFKVKGDKDRKTKFKLDSAADLSRSDASFPRKYPDGTYRLTIRMGDIGRIGGWDGGVTSAPNDPIRSGEWTMYKFKVEDAKDRHDIQRSDLFAA